jgi:Undecaprenyl-phosphate glucose phosphotransferase
MRFQVNTIAHVHSIDDGRLVAPAVEPALEVYSEGWRHPVISGSTCALDGLLLAGLSLLVSGFARDAAATHEVMVAGLGGSLLLYLRGRGRPHYDVSQLARLAVQRHAVLNAVMLSAAAMTVVLMLLSWPVARALPFSAAWLAGGLLTLGAERLVIRELIGHERFAARLVRHVAVIGSSASAMRIEARLSRSATIRVVGRFDDAHEMESGETVAPADIEALMAMGRQERLDAIVVALPYERRQELTELCLRLRTVLADVYVAPYLLDGFDMVLPEARLGPCHFSVAQRRPLTEWQSLQKAVFDRVVASILLLGLSPLLLAIALVVRRGSPGPALFRQTRLGLNNRPFTCLKFRTMRSEAADLLADRQTSRDDDRVTRAGRWLRRLSLDELPQLFNVLLGEMSLVGPRPHAPNTRAGGKLLGDALAEYVIRHQIKPGITGWAQVNGARGELATIEQLRARVSLDLDYMRRWSLMFDLRVLVLTVTREIFSRHAY